MSVSRGWDQASTHGGGEWTRTVPEPVLEGWTRTVGLTRRIDLASIGRVVQAKKVDQASIGRVVQASSKKVDQASIGRVVQAKKVDQSSIYGGGGVN